MAENKGFQLTTSEPKVVEEHPQAPEVHLLAMAFAEQDLHTTKQAPAWGRCPTPWVVKRMPQITHFMGLSKFS